MINFFPWQSFLSPLNTEELINGGEERVETKVAPSNWQVCRKFVHLGQRSKNSVTRERTIVKKAAASRRKSRAAIIGARTKRLNKKKSVKFLPRTFVIKKNWFLSYPPCIEENSYLHWGREGRPFVFERRAALFTVQHAFLCVHAVRTVEYSGQLVLNRYISASRMTFERSSEPARVYPYAAVLSRVSYVRLAPARTVNPRERDSTDSRRQECLLHPRSLPLDRNNAVLPHRCILDRS